MPSPLAVASVITLLLAAYLIVAMLAPEWFA
jgi:K+-transporting ATPase KdpF subunit